MKISSETRDGFTTAIAERQRTTCSKGGSNNLIYLLLETNTYISEENAQEQLKIRVPRATSKFEHLCRSCRFHHVNKPRSHMPMVVIDFDSLILKLTKDNVSSKNNGILALFEDLYPYYNIGTWSSLHMKDFVKLLEDLKIFDQESFEICCCLDNSTLISAFVPSLGNTKVRLF